MDLYREKILDHYQNPRNWGRLKNPTHSAEVYNDYCGDRIVVNIIVKENVKRFDQGIIEKIRFESEGCAISGASASILSQWLKGKQIRQLQKLKSNDIVNMLGIELTPTRLKCALLPLEAVHQALKKS